jgi:hypothetical protein
LDESGVDVQSVKQELDAADQEMWEASAALETIKADHTAIFSAIVIKDKPFLFNQMADQYRELSKSQQVVIDVDVLPYLESVYRFDEAQIAENMGDMLKRLVLGNADYGKPLMELAGNVNSIIAITQETLLPETMQGFDITADNPAYEAIETLLDERERERLKIASNGADDPGVEIALDQIERQYRKRIVEQISLTSAWAEEQLAERIQIIRSLDPAIMAENYKNAALAIQQFFYLPADKQTAYIFLMFMKSSTPFLKTTPGIEEIFGFFISQQPSRTIERNRQCKNASF